jgi:cellulose synthase (UDP-forming)
MNSSPNHSYNFSSKPGDNRPVRVMIIAGLLFMAAFVGVYFQAQNRDYSWLFVLLTISVVFKLLRLLHEWYHYWVIVPATPPPSIKTWTVDVLTTYCRGEPQDMVVHTLRAIQNLTYPHTTYLCDEADDPYLKQVCAEMGIQHVTRQEKTDAKAGNINNALRQATGEVCLVIDPDHVPAPDFFDHILPFFEDAAVGFVQCVQAYSNRKESIVAYGATEQTYSFYGPMMTCMGNYGTAQAIGANCTFRRAALNSIGGHASGLCEDMHTAMQLHANGWESVYVPLPLTYGLVPATLSAYYKQQLKWARGAFELLFTVFPKLFSRLTPRQRLHYSTLPLYYLIGSIQLIDLLVPIVALVLLRFPLQVDLLLFGAVYVPLLLTGFLIRQYAQRWLIERHEAGFHLIGGILTSGTWWVYVLGLVYTLFRVDVPYIPTPKNDRPQNHFLLVLPNLLMCLITLGAIQYSINWYGRFALNNVYSQIMIGFGLLNALILGLNVVIGQEKALAGIRGWYNQFANGHPKAARTAVDSSRKVFYGFYYRLRSSATPLFGGVLVLAVGIAFFTYQKKTYYDHPPDLRFANTQPFYLGLVSDQSTQASTASSLPMFIVPSHLAWSVSASSVISEPIWQGLRNRIPLLYIEPVGIRLGWKPT